MGQDSKIEWTHHTFNIVWGCVQVSPACSDCYAKRLAERYGFDVWGKDKPRRVLGEAYWREPLKWNRNAQQSGERKRVFCSSMADVFEDHPTVAEQRLRLWPLIESTPWLDWLLLSKRPENMRAMLPQEWLYSPRRNVWLGATIENQELLEPRADALLGTPAAVHFFSCEPLLGPLDIKGYRPAWIIAGGESGPRARPSHPDWFRNLRDQSLANGIKFHFKQWGEYGPMPAAMLEINSNFRANDPYRFGKKAAGRLLDGRTWDGIPKGGESVTTIETIVTSFDV